MKIRKLNLDEMWKLYGLLKPFLSDEPKDLLVDEIEKIVRKIEPMVFAKTLRMFCTKEEKTPVEGLLIFIQGMKKNNFFVFSEFIKNMGHK